MSKKTVKQAVHYVFWSVMTTAVSWLTYTGCMLLLAAMAENRAELATLIANAISWFVAVSFSFTVNKLLVFKSKERTAKTLVREILTFFSTRLAVGLIEIVLVPIIVWIGWDIPLFGIDGLLSKCLVTPIIIFLNYLCGRFLVFRTDKKERCSHEIA